MPRRKSPDIEVLSPKDIKALRQKHDITQEEFGMLIGTDGKTVSRWENGTPIRSRAYRILLLKFRDHDQYQPDLEDRIREIRYRTDDTQ